MDECYIVVDDQVWNGFKIEGVFQSIFCGRCFVDFNFC